MFMYVEYDTGKTIRQNGRTTIQGRIATYHTTCVALKIQRLIEITVHTLLKAYIESFKIWQNVLINML